MLTEAGSPTPNSPIGSGSASPTPLSPLAARQAEERQNGSFVKLFRILKRRRTLFLLVFSITTALLAGNALRQRIFSPIYVGEFQLLVTDPLANDGASSPSAGVVESLARTTTVGNTDIPTLIQLLNSPVVLKPIAQSQDVALGTLIGNLEISSTLENEEGVLRVRLRWTDPVQGLKILTALSDSYPKYALVQRQQKLGQGLEFLGEQAPALQKRVNALQRNLKEFRESNNFLEPLAQGGSIISTRDGLLNQLRSLQVGQAELETQLASARSGKLVTIPSGSPSGNQGPGQGSPTGASPQLGLSTNPRADSLAPPSNTVTTPQQQLAQLDQQIATARATFKSDSPQLQSLLAQRNRIKPLVQSQSIDQLSSQLFANKAQQNELNRQILLLNKNFQQNPEEIRKYNQLQQKIDVAQANYMSYIQARENFRLEVAKQTVPWQVISPPQFQDVPVEPNLPREFFRAILLGLILAIAAVQLRERTDNSFHTPGEAEKELGLPVLGLIPYIQLISSDSLMKSLKELPGSERFAIKESQRSLFTTFRHLGADRKIRLVVITSTIQGEGKSTATTFFSHTLVELGLRVLIVDADLRIPSQHKHLGVDNTKGFSDSLCETDHEIGYYIHEINENLFLLPAGSRAPDPARLFNSKRCAEVIQEIRELPGYDLVIFNTPPSLLLSDSVLLGEKVDGILYLVGLGRVGREMVPQAIKRLKLTGIDILGLICNQVKKPTHLNDYGYEYGYKCNYSYSRYHDTYSRTSEPSQGEDDQEYPSKTPVSPLIAGQGSSIGNGSSGRAAWPLGVGSILERINQWFHK